MSTEKTNKAFKKRLKITKNGKVKSRTPGSNHFNAKESQSAHRRKKRMKNPDVKKKDIARFLPHS